MPSLSIAVINDNSAEYCKFLLQSLQPQVIDVDVEVIFLDNCSEDHSIDIARYYIPNIHLYQFEAPVAHRGILYNKGLELASRDYILFVHSDVSLSADFLLNARTILDTGIYDFINFRIKSPDLNDYGYDSISFNPQSGAFLYRKLYQSNPDSAFRIECSEACFIIKKSFIALSGFDIEFHDSFFEYASMLSQPINVYFAHDISVVHYFIEQHSKLFTEDADRALLFQKYHENIIGKLFSPNLAVAPTTKTDATLSIEQSISECSEHIGELKRIVSESDMRIKYLQHVVSARDMQIRQFQELKHILAERENVISQMLSSSSWRLTRPLRAVKLFLLDISTRLRRVRTFHHRKRAAADMAISDAPKKSAPENDSKSVDLELGVARRKDKKSSKGEHLSLRQLPFVRKRILLVSYYCPARAHAGGLRMLDIYRLIKLVFPDVQLDLYTYKRPDIDWSYEDVEKIFNNLFLAPSESLSRDGLCQFHRLEDLYDVIDLQFHQAASDIDAWREVGKKIIFTPMESIVRGLLLSLRLRSRQSPKEVLKHIFAAWKEIEFARKADEVVCVSAKDAASLRWFCKSGKVRALETGISQFEFVDAFEQRNDAIRPEGKQPVVLYVAYFGSATNINALKWFLTQVHPFIHAAHPDYRLQVVGRGDISAFNGYASDYVELVGEVPKLAPYLQAAKVGIAPALSGGGFRGKINQYAIYGVPVVASGIAAEGLAYQDGHDIFIADQARQFAERCIRLLCENDLNKTMGQRARERVFTQYTWESRMDAIKEIYHLEETLP